MSALDICQQAGCGHAKHEHDDKGCGCLHGYWSDDGCACAAFMGSPEAVPAMGLDVASVGDAEGVAALAGMDPPLGGCDDGHPGCTVCDAAAVADERARKQARNLALFGPHDDGPDGQFEREQEERLAASCDANASKCIADASADRVTDEELADLLRLDDEVADIWLEEGCDDCVYVSGDDGAERLFGPVVHVLAVKFMVEACDLAPRMAREIIEQRADREVMKADLEHRGEALLKANREASEWQTKCNSAWFESAAVDAHPSLREIGAERDRQIVKWGDGAPSGGFGGPVLMADLVEVEAAKRRCELAMKAGNCTMRDVLEEEVAEALAEQPGSARQRAELVQVAAVCVKWIELIDRDGAK